MRKYIIIKSLDSIKLQNLITAFVNSNKNAEVVNFAVSINTFYTIPTTEYSVLIEYQE